MTVAPKQILNDGPKSLTGKQREELLNDAGKFKHLCDQLETLRDDVVSNRVKNSEDLEEIRASRADLEAREKAQDAREEAHEAKVLEDRQAIRTERQAAVQDLERLDAKEARLKASQEEFESERQRIREQQAQEAAAAAREREEAEKRTKALAEAEADYLARLKALEAEERKHEAFKAGLDKLWLAL